MTVHTTRFGTVEADEADVVTLQAGLYGFEDLRRFVILNHKPNSPYRWLQSVEQPGRAWLLIDPWEFKPDYAPLVSDADVEALGLSDESLKLVYVVVTVPAGNPQGVTANLAAPIVIDPLTRNARQVVVEGDQYHTRHSILEEMRAFAPKAAAR